MQNSGSEVSQGFQEEVTPEEVSQGSRWKASEEDSRQRGLKSLEMSKIQHACMSKIQRACMLSHFNHI